MFHVVEFLGEQVGIEGTLGATFRVRNVVANRTFDANLFTKKFYYVEQGCWISLKLSAAGLRTINKVGLDAALVNAVAKGYCDWKDIKVIG